MDDNVMLTTFDNPFSPFTQFEIWWKTDIRLGHDCCGTLARESNVSDVASDEVNDSDVLDAMKRICERWPLIFKMVVPEDYPIKKLSKEEKER